MERFSFPRSIFDTYCCEQPMRWASSVWVRWSSSILSSISIAIRCEWRSHDLLACRYSAASRQREGVLLSCASSLLIIRFILISFLYCGNIIYERIIVDNILIQEKTADVFQFCQFHLCMVSLFHFECKFNSPTCDDIHAL